MLVVLSGNSSKANKTEALEDKYQLVLRELEALESHSGIVWNCRTGALEHLGVAREVRGGARVPLQIRI